MAVAYGLLRGGWLAGVLAGITLAMATLPEEFLLVLTVFLALGAWRMSRDKVLVVLGWIATAVRGAADARMVIRVGGVTR